MRRSVRRKWNDFVMLTKLWMRFEMINYSAIIFFIVAGIACSILIAFLDWNDPDFSWHDILVEAHGLIFDLLVFGVLWTVFEFYKNKIQKIRELEDEISSLVQLKTDEARVSINSKIDTLYSLGVRRYFISWAYLKNGSLQEMDLTNSKMVKINLENGSLVRSNLTNVDLRFSNLKGVYFTSAFLRNTKLSKSDLRHANFTDVELIESDLSLCDLRGAEFAVCTYLNSNFEGVKLTNAIVDDERWFEKLREEGVIGVDRLETKYKIIEASIQEDDGWKKYVIVKRKKKKRKSKERTNGASSITLPF